MTDDGLDKIYRDHEGYIAKVFRMQLRKQRDAGIYISKTDEEEIWSWVLAKVAVYLPRYDPSKSALPSYLYTIVASQTKWCLIRMRGMEGRFSSEAWNNAHAHYDDPDQQQNIPEPVQQRTEAEVLEELPEDIRQMAELLLEGKSRRETARLMGWSRRTLQSKLGELREHLTGEPPPETPPEATGATGNPRPPKTIATTRRRATARPDTPQTPRKPRRPTRKGS